MAAVVRVGDTAGGAIQNTAQIRSNLNGVPLAVAGDAVASHPPCPRVQIHCSAQTTASPRSQIAGRRIVVNGDAASCGHGASASASSRLS